MLLTILGLMIILLPFCAVVRFESRLKGFFLIFAVSGAFHLLVALITQATHTFTYSVILGAHLAASMACLALAIRGGKTPSKVRLDWFAVSGFLIIFAFLFSLHFYYTGPVAKTFGTSAVAQSSYTYPFYSDEWIAVSLIDYSIENKSLPLANPLNDDAPFPNLLVGFHSLVAEVMLLLQLNPLTHYAWLAIVNGALVCLGAYFVLRLSQTSVFASVLSAMSIPFITNSGNLAGIWYLMPFSLSLMFLLFGICGFLLKSKMTMFVSVALSFIIYPPMIVFVTPLLFGMYLYRRSGRLFTWRILLFIIALILATFLVLKFDIAGMTKWLVRERQSGGIVSFAIWNVVPVFILPLALFGLWDIWKKKNYYILLPTVFGLLFWVVYSFLLFDFIISPPRVVAITSIFFTLTAGFGIDWLYRYLQKRDHLMLKHLHMHGLKVGVLIAFAGLAVFYPRISLWQKLALTVGDADGAKKYMPAPPITRHLSDEDLALFADIEGKRFIAPLWKGLVVGVATHNYPLDSKASTITNKMLEYDDFMKADCKKKEEYAKKFKIDFAYTKPFDCKSFAKIGDSSEGFALYRISL